MSAFQALPADQRALLSLLLKQRLSYDDLAARLRLEPADVRRRAADALDALAAAAGDEQELDDAWLEALTDVLLEQGPPAERERTRTRLAGDPEALAWATAARSQLVEVAGDRLPELPRGASSASDLDVEAAFAALDAEKPPQARTPATSKLRGGLFLAGLAAVIVVAVILVTRLTGGDDSTASPVAQASGTSAGQGTTAATGATGTTTPADFPKQTIRFTAVGGSGGSGTVQLDTGGVLVVQAKGLPKSDKYLLWFYNSAKDAVPLGFVPYDDKTKQVQAGVQGLPEQAAAYKYVVITRETSQQPSTPTNVVLRSGAIRTQ